MLREQRYIQRQINILADLALGVAAFFLAHWMRNALVHPLIPRVPFAESWHWYSWLLFLFPPLGALFLEWNGYYDPRRIRSWRATVRAVALAALEAALVAFVITVLLRAEGRPSRPQALLIAGNFCALALIKTALMRAVSRRRRAAGADRARILLVGSGEPLRRFMDRLRAHPEANLEVVGLIADGPASIPGDMLDGLKVIGRLEDALPHIGAQPIDAVMIVPEHAGLGALRPLMRGLEEMGVPAHLSLDALGHEIARPEIAHVFDAPVVSYSTTQEPGPALLFKWLFDRAAGAALLVALSPLIALAAAAIHLLSPGAPALFRQTRCGINGRRFTLYKFRSMRPGAEAERASLEALNEMDGPVFKMRDDPRVTPLGRFLRRWSIDEWPQLWNVARGDMSLVGPRPALPEEVERYKPWQRRRLSMRPGLTGLWQVSGRSLSSFDVWMKLDLQYIDNWSPGLDFRILLRTVWAVISGRGAM